MPFYSLPFYTPRATPRSRVPCHRPLCAAVRGALAWTPGFCSRVGFGLDIETAEARRARRVGSNRVA